MLRFQVSDITRGAAALLFGAVAALPTAAADLAVTGTFALSSAAERTVGNLAVRETGPLRRALDLSFTNKATGQRVTRYDEELTQEIHVLATDSNLSTFVHEHARKVGPDGRFRLEVRFPKPGLYHVYADAVPSGLGQQVIRFDVPVDVPAGSAAVPQPPAAAASSAASATATLEGSDGPYAVKLDAAGLRAGTEGRMTLTILKDGRPANDLAPYLGVPAHAVFIGVEDLAYVHAHATAADQAAGAVAVPGHAGHASHGSADPAMPARLVLHATPPNAGRFALWVQFMGGGAVRTVPFALQVPAR